MQVAIVDYEVGNHFSVAKCLQALQINYKYTHQPEELAAADYLILPGVGHFAKAMHSLRSLGLIPVLNELVLQDKKPVLGICLGMQLMMNNSDEAPEEQGLGWIAGSVKRLQPQDSFRYKIPHLGWAQVQPENEGHQLLREVPAPPRMYFAHAYHCEPQDANHIFSHSQYGQKFVSAVQYENLVGFQFHPEKSHFAGLQLLKNFLEWKP